MLTDAQLDACCLKKPCAYADFPFGPTPVCYKVKGRIFAQLYPDPVDSRITLKCRAEEGALYRSLYPQAVVRGYHCPPVQQPYWNTVTIGKIDDGLLLDMIDAAYACVVEKLPRRLRQELAQETAGAGCPQKA